MALIKVFVSHKQEDGVAATRVANTLSSAPEVDVYVDVWDAQLRKSASDLSACLRGQLDTCTHLMVIMSNQTRDSWWVPFEIGLATEKDYPISTFAIEQTALPDYLKKWPYLRTEQDLGKYIRVGTQTQSTILHKGLRKAMRSERATYASDFHSSLRRSLGQL